MKVVHKILLHPASFWKHQLCQGHTIDAKSNSYKKQRQIYNKSQQRAKQKQEDEIPAADKKSGNKAICMKEIAHINREVSQLKAGFCSL